MFCKHFNQILVSADLDVHFTIHAEIKQSHYVTVVMRILVDNFSNQVCEVSAVSIHDFVQRKPPRTRIGSNNPDF